MPTFKMSKGKFTRIQACANESGIIAALALDQRDALRKGLIKEQGYANDDQLVTFKRLVTRVLTPYTSAVLLDPEFGWPAVRESAPNKGIIIAYEKTGYDAQARGRLPDLLPLWSARRLVEAGADVIKVLLYYNPTDDAAINDIKRALIERVGDECTALDVPFFLEPLVYDDVTDPKSVEFARLKPDYVRTTIEEFSRPRYNVDVLKVEFPLNMTYLAGSQANQDGSIAYERGEAMALVQAAAEAAKKPFIYLSGGVDDAVFRESLELAAEANVPFSGVLCGRATWKGGIPVFAHGDEHQLEEWLLNEGTEKIQSLNRVLRDCARPWHTVYGGLENIEIVG
jgi:tagatose 1,6-diphosphate aldolase